MEKKNELNIPKENADIKVNAWGKASAFGKMLAEKMHAMSDKAKDENYKRRMQRYNPVSIEEYKSDKFCIPNIIEIIDDASVKDIDVCVGSIAHREKINGVEMLHIYDEFVPESGITFVPVPECDNVYCVDPFDRTRYINVDYMFSKTHEEKLAELEHIAYYLGAKSCSIELVEGDSQVNKNHTSTAVNGVSAQSTMVQGSANSRSGKTVTYFEGNSNPRKPNLKWFAYDDNINLLIEMRCSNDNSIKSRIIELRGSSCATMSKTLAGSLDKLPKIKGKASMQAQAEKEFKSKLIFEIEF